MMELCVGAVSRRVVEEAAACGVYQIVASRRQVDTGGGYTGYDQEQLVSAVRERSQRTLVVRDHGGPDQGAVPDNGIASLEADVAAGFDAVHLDVSKLDRSEQPFALCDLLGAIGDTCYEIGGEHDEQESIDRLVRIAIPNAGRPPTFVILETGAYIWADRQRGPMLPPFDERMNEAATQIRTSWMCGTKAHNFDFVGGRDRYRRVLDAYNLAPELALVEIDAWLTVLDWHRGLELLRAGYESEAWHRWFNPDQGTWLERARCGVRYVLETERVQRILATAPEGGEDHVREAIRDAISRG